MDEETYRQIYEKLETHEDILNVTREFSQKVSTVSNILHHKVVRRVRKYHSCMVQKAPLLVNVWKNGETIIEISRKYHFPPVLTASIILTEMGHKSKYVIKNPHVLVDKRLKNEIKEAIANDLFYSPLAHTVQANQGKVGEKIIHTWLEKNDLAFLTECDLNKISNSKTPDFLLNEPITINGSCVSWIESKAVFADLIEHNRYQKRQFRFYEELFGNGMVVYWYGFLDNIVEYDHNYIITDHTFFKGLDADVEQLLDYKIVV